MTRRGQQLQWFGVLYVASIAALALATLAIRTVLWLIT
jgi:hypothetical protein